MTSTKPEATVDKSKKKGLLEYQHLMRDCFAEYCRVLKAGRWMTVVFHNSRNAVWTAIQEAMPSLLEVGLPEAWEDPALRELLTVTKAQLKSWPFDLPMFLILNLAIGGTMGGPVPPAAALPMTMTVQSVALYNAEVM